MNKWMLVQKNARGFAAQGADPWITLDGRLNAPAGSPQFSTLLNGYPTASPPNSRIRWSSGSPNGNGCQPPWMVCGVDYAVGITSGTVLKDYLNAGQTDLVPALSNGGVNTWAGSGTSQFVTINTDNFIVDGYDFSLHNCSALAFNNPGCTARNCNFKIGSGNEGLGCVFAARTNATGSVLEKSVCDGSQIGSTTIGLVLSNTIGLVTFRYNLVEHAWAEGWNVGSPTDQAADTKWLMEYNVLDGAGYGEPMGFHGDWIQTVIGGGFTASRITSATYSFNLFMQRTSGTVAQSQGINFVQGQCLSETCNNNTLICTNTDSSTNVNYMVNIDLTWLNGTAIVTQNYIDATALGDTGSPFPPSDWLTTTAQGGGTYSGTLVRNGNTNMVDGSSLG